MRVRSAQAEWNGDLPTGRSTVRTALAAKKITLDAALEG
jgi:hypothetical protein